MATKKSIEIIVCIKQVPLVSELPWNPKTGRLNRERADGMMNPACRNALEEALSIKGSKGADITVISMGPPMAEEVIRESIALGADRGFLLCDPAMAGADTLATSYTLARAVEKVCPGFDLILCGSTTADSETAQVGPQLAEELDLPSVSYAQSLDIKKKKLLIERVSDSFHEKLEMILPGVVTVAPGANTPRYVPLAGVETAFESADVKILSAADIRVDPSKTGTDGSATRILKVYSPRADKQGVVMKGAPGKIVRQLFDEYKDRLGGYIGRDLTEPEEDGH